MVGSDNVYLLGLLLKLGKSSLKSVPSHDYISHSLSHSCSKDSISFMASISSLWLSNCWNLHYSALSLVYSSEFSRSWKSSVTNISNSNQGQTHAFTQFDQTACLSSIIQKAMNVTRSSEAAIGFGVQPCDALVGGN